MSANRKENNPLKPLSETVADQKSACLSLLKTRVLRFMLCALFAVAVLGGCRAKEPALPAAESSVSAIPDAGAASVTATADISSAADSTGFPGNSRNASDTAAFAASDRATDNPADAASLQAADNPANAASLQAGDNPADAAPLPEKDGTYTSRDGVALYIHTYGCLPSNYITKKEAQSRGWESSKGNLGKVAPGMSIGGDRFGNREGLLPDKKGRIYYECDIDYDGGKRNAKRIVFSDDGLVFYTDDHYASFTQLY